MALKFLSYVFSAALVLILSFVVFSVAWFLSIPVFWMIRLFKPTFATIPVTEPANTKTDHREIKKVALDWVMAEKIRHTRELKQRMNQMLNPHLFVGAAPLRISPTEWDLESMSTVIKERPHKKQNNNYPAQMDQWSICKFPNGVDKPAHYLIHRTPTKEGLKTGWGPFRAKALLMSLEAAHRWMGIEGFEDAFVVPMNAAARMKMRLREAASKLSN